MKSRRLSSLVLSLALTTSLTLAGCSGDPAATEAPETNDAESQNDVDLPADSAEGLTIVEFLNDAGTTFELLDETVGLDSRAAENLIAHRDGVDASPATSDDDLYDSIDEIDAIAWVGPAAVESLTTFVTEQGWVTYAGGNYEGVVFNTSQITLALDAANFATFEALDIDAKLASNAAENIVAARPILSMRKLAEIPQVGPATLERLRAFLPAWQLQGVTLETYDGVAFTHQEAAGALAAANQATKEELAASGISGAQDDLLIGKRPFASLSLVTSTAGIGPLTTIKLKTMAAGYSHVPVYLVNASDAAEFASIAEGALRDDEGFGGEMDALLADVTGAEWAEQKRLQVLDAIVSRVQAFSALEIGRDYSSRDAAFDSVYQYGRGLFFTAKTAYPEGVLEFVPPLTTAQKLTRGKEGILAYWQTEFVHTDTWIDVFNGKTWNDVKSQVGADVSNFENGGGYEVYPYPSEHHTIFVGSTYQLYTETTVDDAGKVVRVLVEID